MKLVYRTRAYRLPDDVEHFIQGAAECLDLSYDIAFWLQYICPNPGQLINADNRRGPQHPEDLYVGTGLAIQRVRKAYDKWFNNPSVNLDEKLLCVSVGTGSIRHSLKEVAKFIAEQAVFEAHEGSLYYRRDPPSTKVIRKFRANNRLKGHGEIEVRNWKEISFFENGSVRRNIQDVKDILARVYALGELPDEVSVIITPTQKLAWRKYNRDERKAILRGIELLKEVIGRDKTETFLSTREIEIPAEKFTFRLRLEHLGESHGGVSTEVLVKGEPVCKLCIYTPDTPILDHVASVVWHVQSGLEDDIINTGNPYGVTHPTGIEVLDKRLHLENAGPRLERIVVRSVRPPTLIRIGDSNFTKHLQNKLIRRISGYIFQERLGSPVMPRVKVLYSYPPQITPQMDAQIPAAFIVRTLGDVRNEVLREWRVG